MVPSWRSNSCLRRPVKRERTGRPKNIGTRTTATNKKSDTQSESAAWAVRKQRIHRDGGKEGRAGRGSARPRQTLRALTRAPPQPTAPTWQWHRRQPTQRQPLPPLRRSAPAPSTPKVGAAAWPPSPLPLQPPATPPCALSPLPPPSHSPAAPSGGGGSGGGGGGSATLA